MKITNSEIIKNGERELIDTITGDLDWSSIEQIVRDRHHLNIQDDIEYKQGDLVVHDNKVAYRLDFEVKMTLSVIFDRDGNCLSLATNVDVNNAPDISRSVTGERPPHEISDPRLGGDLSAGNSMSVGKIAAEESDNAVLAPPLSDRPPEIHPDKNPQENLSRIASHIADMISEINEPTEATPPGFRGTKTD